MTEFQGWLILAYLAYIWGELSNRKTAGVITGFIFVLIAATTKWAL